jgi:peptidoglycan/xylan/chitin deacetylase (PgdA/CDA1 family)
MLLPGFTWRVPTPHPILYLTFDDGPVPDVTDFVLGQLAQYEAKATFFCVGDNLRKYPDIAQRAEAAGHRLANHTCHHLPGWRTPTSVYIADIQACAAALEGVTNQKKK